MAFRHFAALVGALSFAFPAPAMAQSFTHSDLLDMIEQTGTQVFAHRCGPNPEIFGTYTLVVEGDRIVTDEFRYCADGPTDVVEETIRHEAIHVAQACRGWDRISDLSRHELEMQMARHYDPATVLGSYDPDVREIEAEAYVYEGLPVAAVGTIVRNACFR